MEGEGCWRLGDWSTHWTPASSTTTMPSSTSAAALSTSPDSPSPPSPSASPADSVRKLMPSSLRISFEGRQMIWIARSVMNDSMSDAEVMICHYAQDC